MNPVLLAAAAVPVVATAAVGGTMTAQHHNNPDWQHTREAIHNAVEANDYEAFANALPEDAQLAEKVTADNFDEFVRMHELRESGDHDGARAIAETLGLQRKHRMHKHGKFRADKATMQAKKQAIQTSDYDAFVEAVGEDARILNQITADNFDEFVRMHELRRSGDKDAAKAIAEELGLKHPHKQFKQQ